jgi:hypothetical protein
MGDAHRARDTKLERDVAIKVLPAAFVEDHERLQRFEREAKLLAQLNHSNIAQIYALERCGQLPASSSVASDGASVNGKPETVPMFALVMELVEGPTLAERLAAHEKGIVHRDLKPQNFKASLEGRVKVLDFGLAKAMDPAGGASGSGPGSASQLAASPTLTLGATQLGVILGTAASMAPEQAQGMAIDKRADIWAFGVSMYEMLVGRSLFAGETVTDTLAGVLKTEIDFSNLPESTPPSIRRLLRRCLERDPRNRLHDSADARIVLEELAAGRGEEAGAAAAPAGAAAGRRARGWAAVAAAAGALAAGLGSGWLLRRPEPPPLGAGARWALAIPDGFALSIEQVPQIALSDDGRLQAAVVVDAEGETRLLLRSVDEVAPRVVPDTEGALAPVFSPDGAWIGFFRERALFKIPAGAALRSGSRRSRARRTRSAAPPGAATASSTSGRTCRIRSRGSRRTAEIPWR